MNTTSEITIKDIWPKLCELGLVELRINGYTVWSDRAMDCMFGRDDYAELEADYRKRAEEQLLGEQYESFRVTAIDIKIVEFHHSIADVTGYYEDYEYDEDDTMWHEDDDDYYNDDYYIEDEYESDQADIVEEKIED